MQAIQFGEGIPEPAQSWLRTTLGDYHVLSAHRVASNRTGVWKLRSHSNDFFFKLHLHRLLWHSEVSTYQHWASAYEPYVPKMIASFEDDGLHGLLVTAIDGSPLKDCTFDEATVVEVYRQAGQLCKRFHDLSAGPKFGLTNEQGISVNYEGQPLGDNAGDPVTFIRNNFVELLNQAQALGGVEPHEQAQIELALASMDVFRQEVPTLVNTDYTSNNWLVDQKGNLVGIIDLEHVFRNVLIDAFTRLLVANYLPGTKAFFDGYGSNPLTTKLMQARIVCLRYALYYIATGIKLNNENWLRRGKQVFRRLDDLFAFVEARV